MILKIARTELRNLFYSPVAWFLTIAFLVQCAVFYTNALVPQATWQDIMAKSNPKFKDFGMALTQVIFLQPDRLFSTVLQNLYLFVPLLTMGLISREINNGTIKLLYSSPVKVYQIVFGKYLAIMIYNLVLVGIVGMFMLTAVFNIQNIDYGMLLSALLGFFLLVSTYTAIGMFMSSLTTYQILSAIGCFLVIFILTRVGVLWQEYDFIRDLTYFLSISGRTAKMLQGLITTKDVFYFLIIVYIFIGFTLLKLKDGRESKPWYLKGIRYLAVFASALLIGYVTSRPSLTSYWDTTTRKINTIHPNTQQVVAELGDEPLEVTLYTNLLGQGLKQGLPQERNRYLTFLWDRYLRFKSNIKFNYVYYYDVPDGDSTVYRSFPGKSLKEIAEQMAAGHEARFSMYKGPKEIRPTIDLGPEYYRVVMQLKYKDKTTFLRTFNDAMFWPDETQVAAAFKRLLPNQTPKLYYLTGNLERRIHVSGEREYQAHSISKGYRVSLLNLGFDADTISLDRQDVPKDASVLILADPKTDLSQTTLSKLRKYIADGGNMFILGEPGKQAVLNPLLADLGVKMMPGNLVSPTEYEMPHILRPYLTVDAAHLSNESAFIRFRENLSDPDNDDSLKVVIPGATALSYNVGGLFKIKPLVMTIPEITWLKQGPLVTDSAKVVFEPQNGDVKGSFPTALQLSRKVNNKEQRIVVSSDADFLSNSRGAGEFFGTSLYSWLDHNQFPIYTSKPKATDTKILIGPGTAKGLTIFYVWVLPILVLVFGMVLLIRRKRK